MVAKLKRLSYLLAGFCIACDFARAKQQDEEVGDDEEDDDDDDVDLSDVCVEEGDCVAATPEVECANKCKFAWSQYIHGTDGNGVIKSLAERDFLRKLDDDDAWALAQTCCNSLAPGTDFCKIVDYAERMDDRAANFFEQNMYGHFVRPLKFPDICTVKKQEYENCYIPLIKPSCPYQYGHCANAAWMSYNTAQKYCTGDLEMPKPLPSTLPPGPAPLPQQQIVEARRAAATIANTPEDTATTSSSAAAAEPDETTTDDSVKDQEDVTVEATVNSVKEQLAVDVEKVEPQDSGIISYFSSLF